MESVRSEGVPFWAESTRYQQLQTGEPQTRSNFRVPENHFIHPIDVDKFVGFNSEIIS